MVIDINSCLIAGLFGIDIFQSFHLNIFANADTVNTAFTDYSSKKG